MKGECHQSHRNIETNEGHCSTSTSESITIWMILPISSLQNAATALLSLAVAMSHTHCREYRNLPLVEPERYSHSDGTEHNTRLFSQVAYHGLRAISMISIELP